MQQADAQSPSPGQLRTAPAPRIVSRLRLLLFSEVCLLSFMAGILFFRYPGPGLLLFCLLGWLDLPRSKKTQRMAALAFSFFLGLSFAFLRAPTAPSVPQWLDQAAFPSLNSAGETLPPKTLRVQGRVLQSTPLQGDRIRTILEDLTPAADKNESGPALSAPSEVEATPYHGGIAWTWYKPSFVPLPGQKIQASLRLSPLRGMANPGAWDIEPYWQDQGVWFRAWSGAQSQTILLDSQSATMPLKTRLAFLRRDLQQKFMAALPRGLDGETGAMRLEPAAAILPALLFGDRSHFSPQDTDLFARATLAHSLALSGLHLGFALLAGSALAVSLGKLAPGLWLHITRPQAVLFLALPVAGLQIWLGNAPVSLVRAFIMLVFWTLLLLLKRPKVLMDGLCAALAVFLLHDPFSLFDVRLQLSALSVATIALCLPGINKTARRWTIGESPRATPKRRAICACDALTLLGLSFCIQVSLLPLVLRIFGSSGLLFPLNLLWLPILGTVVMPLSFLGLFAAGLGLEGMASLLLQAAALPCQALFSLLEGLDKAGLLFSPLMPRPHWLSCAGYWLLCLLLPGMVVSITSSIRRGSKNSGAIRASFSSLSENLLSGTLLMSFCALVMLLFPPFFAVWGNQKQGLSLTILDVGQGQALLLEWGGATAGRVLIDGGGFSSSTFDVGRSIVAPVLTDNALPRLKAVIASHPDTDHLSGLLFILDRFRVGQYFGNGGEALPALAKREQEVLDRKGLVRETLGAGDRLELGPELFLEALWPPTSVREALKKQRPGWEKSNNASIILRLVWKNHPLALLCGDAEATVLGQLLRSRPEDLRASILVLPHHGSASSLAPGLYEAVRPVLALASCGYGNRWGFPSRAVRQSLEDLNIPLYTTAEFGQIRLEWTAPSQKAALTTARETPENRHGK